MRATLFYDYVATKSDWQVMRNTQGGKVCMLERWLQYLKQVVGELILSSEQRFTPFRGFLVLLSGMVAMIKLQDAFYILYINWECSAAS